MKCMTVKEIDDLLEQISKNIDVDDDKENIKTTKTNEEARNIDKICVTTEGLQDLLDCGRPSAVEIGTLAKARVEVGRRVLWNVSKVQSYIDSLAEEQNKDE